ncbi:putative alpha/beta hydrolase [Aspergillus fischeri NRRL 181]|uniref:Alpha/beta fold family hydrolase, putative n=1 Tax=Neosartorya fischeri (strain ATCC 1020 / DSM 3700 / CBS 544.65 / FGSC A1164 / JCM 1740 / NRRL 181 / WB 181) TaxID=331117 RepID=A1DBZ0_NEOFI|nr:alpha/beta fold family hydrolase, putative [Aspergillus fischeri NRRL 181]EAW20380.1 alpha/beta fold family hydrolase, putative [Aspergillus fischeri NRRL 181]
MSAALKNLGQSLARIKPLSSPVATSRVALAYELHSLTPADCKHLSANKHVPIIFLHGFLGSKRENRRISKLLARDLSRPVFAVDLRNHGESGHHLKHDYMEMALDVASFMQSHGMERATLIGHSMGAKTALTLALQLPELVSDVVAIDNCPIHLPLVDDFPRYLEGMAKVGDAKVKTHHEAEKILREYEDSLPIRIFLLSNFVKDSDSPYLKCRVPLDILNTALTPLGDFPHKNEAVQFHNPTLFIRALRSHYIPETAIPRMSSFFPQSRIVNIDCGHWVVQERPEELRSGDLPIAYFSILKYVC